MPLPSLNTPKFLPQNDLQGPCYTGICLPKNALDLFPSRNLSRTYVSCDIIDQDLMGVNLLGARPQFLTCLNDSINNEGGDESSVISSLSDVSSSASRRPCKWQQGAKHARSQCLYCTRSRRQQRLQPQASASASAQDANSSNSMGATIAPCELYSSASATLVAAGMQAGPALARKSTGKSGGATTIQLADMSFHSPESILSEESLPDKLTASILYNVQRMANPVSAKQSKMALLELKQKHPHAFQDICLYSESCKTLGRSSYRMSARRFLQELFLDLKFDAFYVEPQLIITARKQPADDSVGSLSSVGTTTLTNSTATTSTAATTTAATTTPTAAAAAATATAAVAPAVTAIPSNATLLSHKAQLKPKQTAQLASVYETSWENLLMDQSPRIGANKTTYSGLQHRTTPATPRNELHIDDATEDAMNSDDDAGEDVCDGTVDDTQVGSVTAANPSRPALQNSKCCSSGTISQKLEPPPLTLTMPTTTTTTTLSSSAATTPTTPNIENENRQYTRGRFYTLELDLSCTKNKFPITNRNRMTAVKTDQGSVLRSMMARQISLDDATLFYPSMTKSLAASVAKPVGSLYCEKRLQSSKSEAVLDSGGGRGGRGACNVPNDTIKWTPPKRC